MLMGRKMLRNVETGRMLTVRRIMVTVRSARSVPYNYLRKRELCGAYWLNLVTCDGLLMECAWRLMG